MSKIVSIRGGNASGKSWVARQVMRHFKDQYAGEKQLDSKLKYLDFSSFVVIGPYNSACGGADKCKYADVWPAIEQFALSNKNVFVEGVFVGIAFKPWIDLMTRIPDHTLIPICLNTDWDDTLTNLNNRRAGAGKPPMEKLTAIDSAFRQHRTSAKKLHVAGFNPHWVTSTEAVDIAIKELS